MRWRTTSTARARCTSLLAWNRTSRRRRSSTLRRRGSGPTRSPVTSGSRRTGLRLCSLLSHSARESSCSFAGYVLVGVLLLVAAALLALIWAEQARRSRATAFDRVTAAAVDHTRALAGFTGSSVRAWTTAGREIARLRLEANRLAKQRSQLQYALGGACLRGRRCRSCTAARRAARARRADRGVRRARERGGRGDAADDRARAARGGPDGGANARRAQMTIARLSGERGVCSSEGGGDGRKVSQGSQQWSFCSSCLLRRRRPPTRPRPSS